MVSRRQKTTAGQTTKQRKRKLFERDDDTSRPEMDNAVRETRSTTGFHESSAARRATKRAKNELTMTRAETRRKATSIVSIQNSQNLVKKRKCAEQKDVLKKQVKKTEVRHTPSEKAHNTRTNTAHTELSKGTKLLGQGKKSKADGQKGRQLQARIPKKANKSSGKKTPQFVTKCGEKFSEGEFVYFLCETAEPGDGERHEVGEEVIDVCEECQEEIKEDDNDIECDSCLGGFHLKCLHPPLDEVPEGGWVCHHCQKAGGSRRPQERSGKKSTLRAKLFDGIVEICKLLKFWEDGGTRMANVARFCIPEDLPNGREKNHGGRELFYNYDDDIEVAAIEWRCSVLSKKEFDRTTDGDDVFFSEWGYAKDEKRFRRLRVGLVEGVGNEGEFGADDSSGEDSEAEFRAEEEGEEGEDGEEEEEEGVGARSGRGGRGKLSDMRRGRKKGATAPKAANRHEGLLRGLGVVRAPQMLRRVPQTPLQKARAALMLSADPDRMRERESEREEITRCLEEAVQGGEHAVGKCLYISGVPGTGKTATVREVVRSLQSRAKAGEVPPWKLIDINALTLPSPNHTYSALYAGLTGRRASWKVALDRLEKLFSGGGDGVAGGKAVVVVVDELDRLVTKTQTVLYNLFDWPTRPDARITVVGIANTMDLPDRLLPRIVSRMGLKRCTFRPYTRPQIVSILEHRLEGVATVDANAIKKVAMKVASVSGDVRRALELCRRAAEVAESRVSASSSCQGVPPGGNAGEEAAMIQMGDVDGAIKEMFDSVHFKMLERCALHEKLFLTAVLMNLTRTGLTETHMERVSHFYWSLCSEHSIPKLSLDSLITLSCRLGASRVLIVECGARHTLQKIQLHVPSEDVRYVLKKDSELTWLDKCL